MTIDKPIFNIDDTLENQDWIKANSFDFPSMDRKALEATFGLTRDPKQRKEMIIKISKWPTMKNAPKWLRDEIQAVLEDE